MLRLTEKLAQSLKINCLITGENLAQVSSQTIENMTIIEQATNLLIIRPLICFNKEEIMEIAQKIETKKISELKGEDCCSLFIPDNPTTKANLDYVIKIENQLKDKIFELENKIFNNKEKYTF
jgi:thiamine biosynthesis protein ThiI